MRLFGTAALVVALAASNCTAQSAERAPIQFSRAEPQNGSFLRERKLSRDKSKKHHLEEETTKTDGTPFPEEEEIERQGQKETRQQPACSICGDGMEVGNPIALVVFPGQSGQIPCGVLENMGIVGLIPPAQCAVLPQLISAICECQPIDVTTTTVATAPIVTTTPATKPGKSKSSKSNLSLSMSVPSKAGKSIHGLSTSPAKSGGKGHKTVITTKSSKKEPSSSKGSMMIASKASSKGGKSGSKGGKSSTVDAKAKKVSNSKAMKKTVDAKAKKPTPLVPPPPPSTDGGA